MKVPAPGRGGPIQFVGHGHDSAAAYLAIVLHFAAVLVVVAAAVYIVLRILRHRARHPIAPTRSAGLDELDVRYARGEIDRADYVTRRADLLGLTYTPPPPGAAPPPG